MSENANSGNNAACNGQAQPSISQRALAAARQVRQFSPDATSRQRTGTRASEGAKGKAAAKAAAQFSVSPRAVEQALEMLRRGAPELVQAVESGKMSVSAAAKVARLPADVQGKVVAEVVAGCPKARALTAIQLRDGPNESMPARPSQASQGISPRSGHATNPPVTVQSPTVTSCKCQRCGLQLALTRERFCDNCHRILMCVDASYAAAFYGRRVELAAGGT